MENLNEQVENYFEKIKEFNQDKLAYKGFFESEKNSKIVHDLLKAIIYKKRDYLLTDSFMDYIGYNGELLYHLALLCGSYYNVIFSLEAYFHEMMDDILDMGHRLSDLIYYNLLDKTFKKEIIDIVNRCGKYKDYSEFFECKYYCFFDISRIISIVLAYYLYRDRKDNIYEFCDIFLNNIDSTIDLIYLNDARMLEYERLVDYVILKITNKVKTIIK